MAAAEEGSPNNQTGVKTDPNTGLITIDPSHELYLYPSDSPNNALVSTLLDGHNYGHWKKAVEIALIAKNKIGFVRGTCTKPAATSPLFKQ